MRITLPRSAYVLSLIIVALTALATAGGLLITNLYRDNSFVTSTWLGNDAVMLVVAVPLLAIATVAARRGSARAYLIWLGLLQSILYNYGFYLFGAAFNRFFMLYAALFGMSIWALMIGLLNIQVNALARDFEPKTPVRRLAGYMLVVGLGLSTVYIAQWLGFVASGEVPPIIAKTGHPTNIVFALDLSLVVPMLVVGAIWLWRREPWGYVLAAMVNVKGAVYMLGLCAATLTAYWSGTLASLAELTLWATIGIGCAVAAFVLLANLQRAPRASVRATGQRPDDHGKGHARNRPINL